MWYPVYWPWLTVCSVYIQGQHRQRCIYYYVHQVNAHLYFPNSVFNLRHSGFVYFSTLYYLPQYFQVVLGYGPIGASIFLIPVLVSQILLSWISVWSFPQSLLHNKLNDDIIRVWLSVAQDDTGCAMVLDIVINIWPYESCRASSILALQSGPWDVA